MLSFRELHLVKTATCFPVMNPNDFKTEFEILVEYILYFKTKLVVEVATLYQEQSRPRLSEPLAHAVLARCMLSWACLSILTSFKFFLCSCLEPCFPCTPTQ